MRRLKKAVLLIVSVGLFVTVAGALVIGLMLPDGFNLGAVKEKIRSKHPNLFSDIKSTIIRSDKDVTAIGETLDLPVFRLALSRKDMVHFVDMHEKLEEPEFGIAYYAEKNQWRNATLEYDDEVYDIEIKSHARAPSHHRNGKYISLAIKLESGRQINGCRRFSLIVRDHFKAEKRAIYDLAEEFDTIVSKEHLVRVRISGWKEKLYYFDHRLNDAYMETTRRPSLRLFGYSFSPTVSTDKSSIYGGPRYPGGGLAPGAFDPERFRQRFSLTLQELEYAASQHAPLTQRYVGLNTAIAECDADEVERYFDIDYISSIEAVRLICGMPGHFAVPGNLYAFYDTSDGRFYPAFTRDCNMTRLNVWSGAAVEYHCNTASAFPSALFQMISRNDRVRREAYRKIYAFVTGDQNAVRERHRAAREYHEKLSYYGWALVSLRNFGVYDDDCVPHNVTVLRKYLERTETDIAITAAPGQILLDVKPQSAVAIRIADCAVTSPGLAPDSMRVRLRVVTREAEEVVRVSETMHDVVPRNGRIELGKLLEDLEFSAALDHQSMLVPRTYSLLMTFEDAYLAITSKNVSFALANVVTEKPFDASSVVRRDESATLLIAPDYEAIALENILARWRERHPELNVTPTADGKLILAPGQYTLTEDVLIPKGLKLVLEAGTTLRIGENKVLVSFGGLEVNGTADEPVFITSIDEGRPFGSVGVLGDEDTKSTLRHLHVSNGSERWVEGVYFSGTLSLHYNGTVHMTDCVVEGGHADDGLNIKYGKVELTRCLFKDNAADQVDLDICTGTVTDCRFLVETLKDTNGDGLDISGAELLVRACDFRGFRDKGMSIGEQTNVVCAENTFFGNAAGMAVKDLSHAYLIDNVFEQNKVDVDAFQKKKIFGGGRVHLGMTPAEAGTVRVAADALSIVSECMDASFRDCLSLSTTREPLKTLAALEKLNWVPVEANVTTAPSWRPEE